MQRIEALGLLMCNAGVAPSRVEGMVGVFMIGQGRVADCRHDIEVLRKTLSEGFNRLEIDQNASARTLNLAMSIFRSEARVCHLAFVTAVRRMNHLIIVVILLQIMLTAAVLLALFAPGWPQAAQTQGVPLLPEAREGPVKGAAHGE